MCINQDLLKKKREKNLTEGSLVSAEDHALLQPKCVHKAIPS